MNGMFEYDYETTAPVETTITYTLTSWEPNYTWMCEFFGTAGFIIYVDDAHLPNRFHRWMQKVLLGVRWTKLDNGKKN